MKKKILILIITLSLFSSFSHAEDNSLDTIISHLEQTCARINSLTAYINRSDFSNDFNETDEVSGKIYYKKPDKVLWNIQNPDKMKILLNQKEILMYIPEINQVQQYKLEESNYSKYMPIGLGASTSALKDIYDISLLDSEEDYYHLNLEPKPENKSKDFNNIQLWVNTKTWFPVKSIIFYPNKDTTTVILSKLKINPLISDRKFILDLPEDVEVVDY